MWKKRFSLNLPNKNENIYIYGFHFISATIIESQTYKDMNPQGKDRPMIDWFSTSDGNVYRKINSWFNQPKCGSVHKFTKPTT